MKGASGVRLGQAPNPVCDLHSADGYPAELTVVVLARPFATSKIYAIKTSFQIKDCVPGKIAAAAGLSCRAA